MLTEADLKRTTSLSNILCTTIKNRMVTRDNMNNISGKSSDVIRYVNGKRTAVNVGLKCCLTN